MSFFGRKKKDKGGVDPSNPYAGTKNPYESSAPDSGGNPYASSGASNPYGGSNPYGSSDPYGGSNPYASSEPTGYGGGDDRSTYGASIYDTGKSGPYGSSAAGADPYSNFGGGDAGDANKGSYGYGSGGYGAPDQPYDPQEAERRRQQIMSAGDDEEDADVLKHQIRFIKQESVASTRNALRAAARAEEVGRDTLVKLGEQGEKLHQTELSLQLAKNHGMVAEDQAAQLKKLNRSMFVPVAGNPFSRGSKAEKEEGRILERHRVAREERERIHKAGLDGQELVKGGLRPMAGTANAPRQKMSLADKAKYQFEADEEDDAMEEEIDDNLHQLSGAIGRLNGLAKAQGQAVVEHNVTIGRLNDESEVVHQQIDRNTHRINKIH